MQNQGMVSFTRLLPLFPPWSELLALSKRTRRGAGVDPWLNTLSDCCLTRSFCFGPLPTFPPQTESKRATFV